MDSNKNYYGQSMDEIVFDNRNKGYGAFQLRTIYQKTMIKALAISVSIFVLGLYSPKVADKLGLLSEEEKEIIDTTVVVLEQPPDLTEEETPPPPPPPPPVEKIIERATTKFVKMLAVDKEEAKDDPPKNTDLDSTDIGKENKKGTKDDGPPPPDNKAGTGSLGPDPNKLYLTVDKQATFKGGDEAFTAFLDDNLEYPEAEQAMELSGRVVVEFEVSVKGELTNVRVKQSSGHKGFDNEAVRVVKKASGRFNPAQVDGHPVRSLGKQVIIFEYVEE